MFEAFSKAELLERWWVPKSMGMALLSCEVDKEALDAAGTGAADAMVETFDQLDQLLVAEGESSGQQQRRGSRGRSSDGPGSRWPGLSGGVARLDGPIAPLHLARSLEAAVSTRKQLHSRSMYPFRRDSTLVSPGSPDSVLMRLSRNVTADATPGVPFAGRVEGGGFHLFPVWTLRPRWSTSPGARRAFRVPVCSVRGTISAAGEGTRIGLRVRLEWPLPVGVVGWVLVYVNGLRDRPLVIDDFGILAGALVFWSACAYLVSTVMQACIREVARLAMAEDERASRP